MAVDGIGNLYIVDGTAQRVRKVDTQGIIRTVAGNGTIGFSGDGGPATGAAFFGIQGIAVDSAGNIYIVDNGNKRVRKVDASSGIITTAAGNGSFGNTGDGGVSTSATLSGPNDVAVDSSGNLYIADGAGGRIRKVAGSTPPPVTNLINTVAGGGTGGDGSAARRSIAAPQSPQQPKCIYSRLNYIPHRPIAAMNQRTVYEWYESRWSFSID